MSENLAARCAQYGNLEEQVSLTMWPTPAARDYKGANSREHCELNGTGRKHMDQLPNAVKYITPRVGGEESLDSVEKRKGREAAERHNTLASVEAAHGEQLGQLNPDWVEWLMGWPIGWTSMESITKLDWRDWSVDPADEGEPCNMQTPTRSDYRGRGPNSKQQGLPDQVKRELGSGNGSIPRVATGIKCRADRLKAIGNGQVPQVAALAWTILNK